MARNMAEKSTDLFRTVVKTTFLEDQKVDWRMRSKGEVLAEVFGPYQANAQNHNYSMVKLARYEKTDIPRWNRRDFTWMSNEAWQASSYSTAMRENRVEIAKQVVQHQKIKPVFAINANGTLSQALDWVDY